MLRTQLLELVRQTAAEAGLDFQNGFPYRMTRTNLSLPALWLAPPSLIRVEGRKEGEVIYRMVLYLMVADRKYDEWQKEQQWEAMERQALDMLRRIVHRKSLFHIEQIACTPAEFNLTNRGELSLKVECDVRITFCAEDYRPV